jgi:hypothetical protein
VTSSPYDQKIIELQGRIDRTALPYGSSEKQDELRVKLATKAEAPAAVQVDNSQFYAKRGAVKEIVTGGGDLVDDVRNDVRKLDEIGHDELPDDLKGLTGEQLRSAVTARQAEREKLEAEMKELSKQRDAYVAEELKHQPGSGQDSFDKRVTEALSAQF